MSGFMHRSRSIRRGGLALLAALLLTPLAGLTPATAAPDGSGVVINEVYARGGSANQPFTHKFVELHNPTDDAISLAGLSLQYRAATGTGTSTRTIPLTGSIPAEGYYLIEGGSNADNGVALPTPDASDTGLNLQGSNGTVALVEGTTGITLPIGDATDPGDDRIIDLVGYGTSNTWEGSATAETSGANSDPQSITRTDGADTDDNRADFTTTATPTPTNSLGETSDGDGDGNGDGDGDPEPGEVIPIAEIQGTGDTTPLNGQTVTTRGVVTGAYPAGGFNGVFIQTAGTGGDLTGHDASHGIFVFSGSSGLVDDVVIGDYVQVTGTAGEFFGLTQIAAQVWDVLDEEFAPLVPAEIELPAVADREPFESMLIAPQGSFTITDTYHTNRFGWLGLAAGDAPLRQPTDVLRPGPEASALLASNADRGIRLDDGSSHDWTNFNFDDHETPVAYLTPANPARVGAGVEFTDPVILDYRRTIANQDSTWNVQPQTRLTGASTAEVQPITWTNTRPAGVADVGGDVTLATFNVLNYFTSLGIDEAGCQPFRDREGLPTTANFCDVRGAFDTANLERQTEKIVSALISLDADVVALQEIENSISFVEGNQPADRDHALVALVEALNTEADADVWDHVASAPEFPAGEDVIRNAFIYQTDAVVPIGDTTILLDSDAFANAREPMAQQFAPVDAGGEVVQGTETFVVINNHFKSKSSGGASGDNADTGDGQGAYNGDRTRQAGALLDFADEVATEAGTELVFLAGDFNSYTYEDPMMVFDDAGYTNLGQTWTEKSTYSFDSMAGSLDHILASPTATAAVTGADIWNINAAESIAFEYSRYNYNVTDFHDASPYRSSDHDPIIVGIALQAAEPSPTVEINLLAFNDFHGRLFDYTRDDSGEPTGNATLAFAGTIEELRSQAGEDHTLVFSSGDHIGASLFTSSLQEDRPTIEFLNALDLEFATVGNHEFDRGYDHLVTEVDSWADFPHVGANVRFADTGAPALPEYQSFTIDGVRVAVIGVVTAETPTLVLPDGVAQLTFEDPVAAVNRVAAAISADHDVIIASFHEGVSGVGPDSTLESKVADSAVFAAIVNNTTPLVSAIFNAHTHQLYAWDAPVPGSDGAFRPVIQADSFGSHVSRVVLSVDRATGEVIGHTARNVPITTTPMSELLETFPRVAAAKEVLDAALEEAAVQGGVVIGAVTADITTAFTPSGARDDRGNESTLGNLVANVLRDSLAAEHLGAAQIGVVNPGGLRAELFYGTDGQVTFAEANSVLPFLNDLWTLTLTGEQFTAVLEEQFQPASAANPFLHLGLSDNVSYTLDPGAPEGERITSVMVDGVPLEPEAAYRIGTFSFLAAGGDNFVTFRQGTDVQQTGLIDRDAWISYIGQNSPLAPSFARRATVVTPLPSALVAGEEVAFEVSGLDLTSLGSPANTELSVYLVPTTATVLAAGEPVHVATVSDGAATVSFTVGEDIPDGEYFLEMVAQPSGTTIRFPVTVTADQTPPVDPGEPGEPVDPGEPIEPGDPGKPGKPVRPGLPSSGADVAPVPTAVLLLLGGVVLAGAAAIRRREAGVS